MGKPKHRWQVCRNGGKIPEDSGTLALKVNYIERAAHNSPPIILLSLKVPGKAHKKATETPAPRPLFNLLHFGSQPAFLLLSFFVPPSGHFPRRGI